MSLWGRLRSAGRVLRGRAIAFEGAATKRRLSSFIASRQSINSLVAGDQIATLRARSHDVLRNNALASSAANSYVANVVGNGIVPTPMIENDDLRRQVMELWDDHVEHSDADGVCDLYGQQAMAVRAFREGGDCFIRIRPRRARDGLTIPVQYQLLEAEMVDHSVNELLPNGRGQIVAGIEFDRIGQRQAYWMHQQHPGEMNLHFRQSSSVRVPASQVIHVFQPMRPGQVRGVPALAPVLARLRELDKYDDAELVRKQITAMLCGFIVKQDQESDPLNTGTTVDHENIPLATLEPGTMQDLLPGEDVRFTNVPADSAYQEFMRVQTRFFAVGAGVTYEQATGDLSGVNYSSIRAGLLEFYRQIEQVQRHVVIYQMMRPIWRNFVVSAVLAGALRLPREQQMIRAHWRATPGRRQIDPEKEVKAIIRQIRAGLMTRSEAVAMMGFDAEQLDREMAADNDRADGLGLTYDSDSRQEEPAGINLPDEAAA